MLRFKNATLRAAAVPALIFCAVCACPAQKSPPRMPNRGTPAPAAGTTISELQADQCYRRVVKNEQVEAFRVEIPARGSTLLNHHRHDYLVVSQGPSRLTVSGGATAFALEMQDGEIQVVKGGWPHRLVNNSDAPARLIQVNVPASIGPEHPVCGLAHRRCSDGKFAKTEQGEYLYTTLFETETVKLRRFELGAGVSMPEYPTEAGCLVVALAPLRLSYDVFGKGITETSLERGDSAWLNGMCVRGATNTGKDGTQFLTLEIKAR
jgi:mannose-6-phosphate isomerase-like protein (cupin superfamily)